jgi:hypothetical protein
MTRKQESPHSAFLNDQTAPEFFADEAIGFFLHNGHVSITFVTDRCTHVGNAQINRTVVARVILPVAATQMLASRLADFLKAQNPESNTADQGDSGRMH